MLAELFYDPCDKVWILGVRFSNNSFRYFSYKNKPTVEEYVHGAWAALALDVKTNGD